MQKHSDSAAVLREEEEMRQLMVIFGTSSIFCTLLIDCIHAHLLCCVGDGGAATARAVRHGGVEADPSG